MMKTMQGIYAPLIEQYISFKRGLGYKYKSAEYRFAKFDRFTIEQGCAELGISKELFEKWAQKNPNEKESYRYSRVIEIRNFSLFLNDLGIKSYICRTTKHAKSDFVPYIFTHDEIIQFFNACDNNVIYGYAKIKFEFIISALYRLVYGCGLRISEALYLKNTDVNMREKYLVLRNTKNNNERMVPFSDSVYQALKHYVKFRDSVYSNELYFFAKAGNQHWSVSYAYDRFRKILFRAGISHQGNHIGPRLHDFRHSFSIHILAKMSEDDLDLYYSLPILSQYLGHASLEATEQYVRLTSEMYPHVLSKVNQICKYVFPEVSNVEKI